MQALGPGFVPVRGIGNTPTPPEDENGNTIVWDDEEDDKDNDEEQQKWTARRSRQNIQETDCMRLYRKKVWDKLDQDDDSELESDEEEDDPMVANSASNSISVDGGGGGADDDSESEVSIERMPSLEQCLEMCARGETPPVELHRHPQVSLCVRVVLRGFGFSTVFLSWIRFFFNACITVNSPRSPSTRFSTDASGSIEFWSGSSRNKAV